MTDLRKTCQASLPQQLGGCGRELKHDGICMSQSEIDFYGSVAKTEYARATPEQQRSMHNPFKD